MMFETDQKPATAHLPKRHSMFRVNLGTLPMMVVGFLLIIFALREAPWEPDYENAPPWESVTHWERAIGDDIPEGIQAERPTGYAGRRLLDYVIYGTIPLGAITILLLGMFNNPTLFGILVGIGFYGVIYAGSSGFTAGPLMIAGGYALILVSATLGWLTSHTADEDLDADTSATV